MMTDDLLILITRMSGKDEWTSVWKFSPNDFIAFVRSGKVTSLTFQQFKDLDLSGELSADVWIVNGGQIEGERERALHASLDKIPLDKRKVKLRIHRGGANFVRFADFQDKIEQIQFLNTKCLFKEANDYGIGDTEQPDQPFVRFAQILSANEWNRYQESLNALRAPMYLHMRIANVMHHLSYVLHPLDIDFQGLLETDFQPDYWKDVVQDYKGGKALEKLNKTRELIYAKPGTTTETAEVVIAEAERRFGKGAWTTPWEKLQKQHLPKKKSPESVKDILPLIQDESEANLNSVRAYFKEGKNPIHEWVTNINKALGEIRDALIARESA